MKKILPIFILFVLCSSAFAPILKPPRGAIRPLTGHPLSRGFVACWLMNEGGGDTVRDLSGNNHNSVTFQNSPTWIGGRFGTALNISASNDEDIQIDVPELTFNAGDAFTVNCWFKINAFDTDDWQYTIGKSNRLGHYDHRGFVVLSFKTGAYLELYSGTEHTQLGSISAGQWYQLAITMDTNHIVKGFINGKQRGASLTVSDDLTGGNNYPLHIAEENYGGHNRNGATDHVMIWNRALTASEIAYLYRNPFCMFEGDESYFWVAASGGIEAVIPQVIMINMF